MTKVTLTGVDKRGEWPTDIRGPWTRQGLTTELDLDPFLASAAQRGGDVNAGELEVRVEHPLHLIERVRVPLSNGVEFKSGRTVYEVRVRLASDVDQHVFWPELTLAVRDANTRAHLKGVELRCVPTSYMGLSQQPARGKPFTSLGGGLSSPIVMRGGRETDGAEDWVAGLALGPATGGVPHLLALAQTEAVGRGVMVYARAPGYAWGRVVLDVSAGAERELLLGPAATLSIRMTNVQLEGYAALDTQATLCIVRTDSDGEENGVRFQRVDETLQAEGLQLEGLEPGEYAVSVELGRILSHRKRPGLVREEFPLAPGESRELTLTLADLPALPPRATLGGMLSFPACGGEDGVRLQLIELAADRNDGVEVVLSPADLERVGGMHPTWSFRARNLPVGLYRARLWPLQTAWMIELPAGGREDVDLVVPELAEVLVETVDARTGERIPLDELRFSSHEVVPGRVSELEGTVNFEGEPGRFHFWTAPGTAYVRTQAIPSGLNVARHLKDLELIPGPQSIRFHLAAINAIRFEFQVDGAALPRGDSVGTNLSRGIRAIDHEGHVTLSRMDAARTVEVSNPGVYEVSFEGVGADRFLTIPPQRVDVREGETARVIIELRRK